MDEEEFLRELAAVDAASDGELSEDGLSQKGPSDSGSSSGASTGVPSGLCLCRLASASAPSLFTHVRCRAALGSSCRLPVHDLG